MSCTWHRWKNLNDNLRVCQNCGASQRLFMGSQPEDARWIDISYTTLKYEVKKRAEQLEFRKHVKNMRRNKREEEQIKEALNFIKGCPRCGKPVPEGSLDTRCRACGMSLT